MKKLESFSYEEPYMELVFVETNEVVTLSEDPEGSLSDTSVWPGV